MYEYIPEGKRKGMKGLCMGLFVGAVVLFFASGIEGMLYPSVMQMAAVIILAVAIMLMGRYLLRHYLYRIADDGEGLDFLVDELSRRGRYTVCRLGLSKLLSAEPWSDETKPKGSKKIYNYCVEMKPRDSWILEFEDGEDRIYVRLSPDEKLIAYFREAVAARRQADSYFEAEESEQ